MTDTTRKIIGWTTAAAFVGSVAAANYLTARYHFIPVGFGQMAVAGTFAAGLALGLRDFIQDTLGRLAVVVTIGIAGAVSFAVSPAALAAASTLAFLASELADFAVYTPLRNRARFGDHRWAIAVTASNLVGAVVDTALFLAIAFGTAAILPGLPGQLVGKGWTTLAVLTLGVLVGLVIRRDRVPHPALHRTGASSDTGR